MILDLLTTCALFMILNCFVFFDKVLQQWNEKELCTLFFLRISLNSLLSGWSRCAPDKTGSEDFYGFVPTPGYLANNWNPVSRMFPGRCVCIDVGYDSALVDMGSTVLWGTCLSSLRRGHANLRIVPILGVYAAEASTLWSADALFLCPSPSAHHCQV